MIKPNPLSEKRRLALVRVNMVVFQNWLTTGWEIGSDSFIRCEQGIPPTAKLVSAQVLDTLEEIWLFFEDESFPLVETMMDVRSQATLVLPTLDVIYSHKNR